MSAKHFRIDKAALNAVYEIAIEGYEYPWSGSRDAVERKRDEAVAAGLRVGTIERTVDRVERESRS
jgi:hypothetical protein